MGFFFFFYLAYLSTSDVHMYPSWARLEFGSDSARAVGFQLYLTDEIFDLARLEKNELTRAEI